LENINNKLEDSQNETIKRETNSCVINSNINDIELETNNELISCNDQNKMKQNEIET
jgi:hypothetical protein